MAWKTIAFDNTRK